MPIQSVTMGDQTIHYFAGLNGLHQGRAAVLFHEALHLAAGVAIGSVPRNLLVYRSPVDGQLAWVGRVDWNTASPLQTCVRALAPELEVERAGLPSDLDLAGVIAVQGTGPLVAEARAYLIERAAQIVSEAEKLVSLLPDDEADLLYSFALAEAPVRPAWTGMLQAVPTGFAVVGQTLILPFSDE